MKSLSKKRSHNPTQITPRLQRLIDFLSDGLWHTTGAIRRATSDGSETKGIWILINVFGYDIETEYAGTNINGRRVFKRRMV